MNRKERRFKAKIERGNKKMKTTLKTINFADIKTPTTVEEFRHNLRKYVCAFGKDAIYVQNHDGIAYDKINSFDDIYTLTGTGFGGDGKSPLICLTVDWSFDRKGGVSEYMSKTKQYSSCDGYWEDKDSEFTIYKGEGNMCAKLPNPVWTTLDNQVLRELYMKMFGDFSGYRTLEEEVA